MKRGLPPQAFKRDTLGVKNPGARRPTHMMHAGLDLSRKRLEVVLLSTHGERLEQLAVRPTVDGLQDLAGRAARYQLAPLACKTDKIDAWVLAELSRRDLV